MLKGILGCLSLSIAAMFLLNADEVIPNVFEQELEIKKIFFDSHSYLRFGDKFLVHDPDCGCDNRFIGWMEKRNDGWIIHMQKQIQSDYD